MTKEIVIEPLTRIEGHLAIHATVDEKAKKYIDAYCYGTMYRGIETILKNREPADAIWITQRICGVCPVPHATASVECVEMTYNICPPPIGIALRNFTLMAEELYDAPLGCCILEGPDYSEIMLNKYAPDVFKEAQNTKAEHSSMHGFSTIADICKALNPISGSLWLKAINISKIGRKMASLIAGKHPHQSSFVPGGIGKTFTATDIEQYADMLSQHISFSKEFVLIFDDLLNFMDKFYSEIGKREAMFLSAGCYEDIEEYNAKYSNMGKWGEKRAVTPGVFADGKIITNNLIEINLGIREYVNHSYYNEWDKKDMEKDPIGNELDKNHPWNEQTDPKPQEAKRWNEKYTWLKCPRWQSKDGKIYAVEVGPLARMYITAVSKKVPESTGNSIKFILPETNRIDAKIQGAMNVEWKIPKKINALERIRARAYFHAYTAYVTYKHLLDVLNRIKKGEEIKVWNKYAKPREGVGVGMVEAMRGIVAHWCIMKNKKSYKYQIIAPTTWNMSPRDNGGNPGPCEQAIIGTPLTENGTYDGIDVVRVVRSFDPCLGCAVHIYDGKGVLRKIKEIDHHHS